MLGYVDENNDDLGVWDLGDYEDNHHNNDTKQQSNDTNYHLDLPKGLTPYEHDMDHYINWHKSHPHSSTPRKLRASSIETHVHVCEENPQLAYIQSQKKRPPIPKDFTSKTLGQNAKFKEVTDLAHGIEHEKRLNKRDDHLDPWWMHSVKVQSSIFHAKEPNTNNIYKEEDNEDDIYYDLLQKYQTHQERHEQKLREKEDELAISAAWGKPNRNIKRSKLNKSHRSKYTINGKAELSDYYSDRFEKAVQIALDEYRLAAAEQEQRKKKRSNNQEPEEENNPDIDRNENINNGNQSFISKQLQLLDQQQSSHLSKPLNSTSTAIQPFDTKSTSSTKPKTTTTTRSIKDTNLAKYQEYEDYKNALGGEKGIKNITEKLVKYSKKINQQNQSHDVLSIMDRGMDFLDACLHLNSVQVHCLLSFGADPNSVTCDEEPVFYMIFQKILYIDERVLDEENRVE